MLDVKVHIWTDFQHLTQVYTSEDMDDAQSVNKTICPLTKLELYTYQYVSALALLELHTAAAVPS